MYVLPLSAVQMVVNSRTMEEWINRNVSPNHSAVSLKRLPGFGSDDSVPQNLVEVEADFQRGQQEDLQHEMNYYFTLRGAIFRLRLLYWKDDRTAVSHRAACQFVLRSIRATTR